MPKKLPVSRKNPLEVGTQGDIRPELKEQLTAREKRRAKERKNKRPKATYDLPRTVIDAIIEISEAESVPRSDLVAWAIAEFVLRYRDGKIDLEPHKELSGSLRFTWSVELPEHLSL